jgi:hypothetical protein
MVYRKNRKKSNIPMDIDDVSEEECIEEKENSESEDEYVVEKIINHRKIKVSNFLYYYHYHYFTKTRVI